MPKLTRSFLPSCDLMDWVTVKPFPDLPTDVAQSLLETAAWEDACTAEALTRVSKMVRQWIDPILYHTVTLRTVSQLIQFHQSIMLRNDSAFFARSVKLLRLGDFSCGDFKEDGLSSDIPELDRRVLNECSGVRRLAFWLMDSKALFLHAFSGYIRPSHLSMIDMRFTLDEYVKFVPPSLTHLHLDDPSEEEENVHSIPWQVFAACPGLSHICLSGHIASCFITDRPGFMSLATDLLAALPSNIAIFVLYVDYLPPPDTQSDIDGVASDIETLSAAASDRLVVIRQADCHNRHYYGRIANLHCFLDHCDIQSDWGDGGATDIWEFADICLLKQRRRNQLSTREAKLFIRDGE
ncbi:hypothetical protein BDZ89DRAFT_1161299 [Hymenopellis radicata]|nr:hypothetical protein BDZ89DRAFT_1161299 [Hymenopellis radicata]